MSLVNSVNEYRIEGQKTAAFEIVDALGVAPDVHCLPVGNAGNITAYWKGYTEYAADGLCTDAADARLPGRRRGADRARRGRPRAAHHRHRDPDRQPGVVDPRAGRPRRQRRPDRRRHRPADPRGLPAAGPPGGRVRRARVGGQRRRAAASPARPAPSRPGSRVVCTVTGNGLKDPDWAINGAPAPGTIPADAEAAAAAAGALMAARRPPPRAVARAAFRAAPVQVRVPATSANLGPGFDAFGLALGPARPRGGPRRRGGPAASTWRARAPARSPPTRGTWWSARCGRPSTGSAASPAACELVCANRIPHGRGLGSSAAAIVGGHPRRPGAHPRRRAGAARRRGARAGHRDRGPPRQRRRLPARRGHHRLDRGRRRRPRSPGSTPHPELRALALVPPVTASTEAARGLLPAHGAARRRGGQRRPGGPARAGAHRSARTCCCRPPATGCTRTSASPPCPASHALVQALRARGVAAAVSGAGPTVLALTTGSALADVLAGLDGPAEAAGFAVARARRWTTALRSSPRWADDAGRRRTFPVRAGRRRANGAAHRTDEAGRIVRKGHVRRRHVRDTMRGTASRRRRVASQ